MAFSSTDAFALLRQGLGILLSYYFLLYLVGLRDKMYGVLGFYRTTWAHAVYQLCSETAFLQVTRVGIGIWHALILLVLEIADDH